MLVPSAVAQPDIVAGIGKDKPWRFVLLIDEPGIRGVQQPMLQDHRLQAFLYFRALLLDAEDFQDVAVLGYDVVGLGWVVEVAAVVEEGELCLWVDFLVGEGEE